MTPRARLYRLAVRCPQCSVHPIIKVYEHEISEKAGKPEDWPVMTLKCQGCGEIYTITARAYHRAA